MRKKELEFFYEDGASRIFPDAWEKYLAPIARHERNHLIEAYHRRLCSADPAVQIEAAKAWTIWEASTSKLFFDPRVVNEMGEDQFALTFAQIENHYFINDGFFEYDGYLLDQVERMRHIPAVIVQGRYDIVCPMDSAWELAKRWPEAKLVIVPDAGHSQMEPGIAQALVAATNTFSSN